MQVCVFPKIKTDKYKGKNQNQNSKRKENKRKIFT
jgi:hypothetical protein